MAVRTRRCAAALFVGALTVAGLAACGSDDDDNGGEAAATSAASGDCGAYADFGKFDGKTVSVYSSIRDIEATRFEESFKDFEKCTGIDIKWEGTGEFEAQLRVRVEGGNAPDIATIPQPGLLADLVSQGAVKAPTQAVMDEAKQRFTADWLKYGSVDGKLYAPPLGANVKSFVWYSPYVFKANGWTVPKTWDDLLKLSDTIAAKGAKPWCAGIASGDATGWPATDWLEDLMLRTAGPDVYDQWTTHDIPFNDPKVATALDEVGKVLRNDKYVNGGYGDVKSIATTTFQEAGLPILKGECALHRQASFYANQWPKDKAVVTVDPNEKKSVFAFYFPGNDPAKRPVLGGGEFVAQFNDKPEVEAVQKLFLSDLWVNKKAGIGDWISANNTLDVANVKNPIDKLSVQILQDKAAVFRFDGSDLMPGAVGAGSFWKQMTNWIANNQSTEKTLTNIENSWPKS
jgi:alpha-glucoside transport system substrate-binding protein